MRKYIYFPEHIKDKLLKFRLRNGMIDEQIALIRLVSVGLDIEEAKHEEDMKNMKDHPVESI